MAKRPEIKPQKITRAVAYFRVSTDDQAMQGVGLPSQRTACRDYAKRAKIEIIGEFREEGISGAAPLDKRPQLIEALRLIAPGVAFLVGRRDRLGRDPLLVSMLESMVEKRGGKVISAAGEGTDDDSPTSILTRRMIDAIAEFERLKIKVNTRSGLAELRATGRNAGTVPFGKMAVDDGQYSKRSTKSKDFRPSKLVDNPAELETMGRMVELAGQGLGLRAIARRLSAEGRPTKSGRPWHPASVARILDRARESTNSAAAA